KIILALIASPILAFIVGFTMYSIFKVVFKNNNLTRTNRNFRFIQIGTAALQALSHGTNDAQKAMGILTMALISATLQSTTDIDVWDKVRSATPMGLRTAVGGWKLNKTVR